MDGSLTLAAALIAAVVVGFYSQKTKYSALRLQVRQSDHTRTVRYWAYQPASQLIATPYLRRGSLKSRTHGPIRQGLYGAPVQNAYPDSSGVPVQVYLSGDY